MRGREPLANRQRAITLLPRLRVSLQLAALSWRKARRWRQIARLLLQRDIKRFNTHWRFFLRPGRLRYRRRRFEERRQPRSNALLGVHRALGQVVQKIVHALNISK